MGDGLILGIDLCDDYSQISYFNTRILDAEAVVWQDGRQSSLISTVICKRKGVGEWLIGEEAYRQALIGEGTMVDKLVKLLIRSGTATIEGIKYSAIDLFTIFLGKILAIAFEQYGVSHIESLVLTLQEKEATLIDQLIGITDSLSLPRDKVHVVSHTESYLFYVLSQKKEIWANQTCLFDLTKNGLHYYEMNVTRGLTPPIAEAHHNELEEGFNLEILETPSGRKLADKILISCAERLMQKKVISAVFLTGKGFEKTDWAPDFLAKVCQKRRAFLGQNLFAKGAAFLAYDYLQDMTSYPFTCLCEGRLGMAVSMNVFYEGSRRQLMLAKAGSNWYESKAVVPLILDDLDSIDFQITSAKGVLLKNVSVSLDDFPHRPNKTTRLEVSTSFTAENAMTVRVIDQGFGEFYPSSGRLIKQEFIL